MRNEAICIAVGRRLRQRRRLLDLTQAQVAARCGLTFQQIQKYEAGLVDLSIVRLLALTRILSIPAAEILDGLQFLTGDEDRVLTQYPRAIMSADHAVSA
jgi:transcriptional regulator with XRE-family HTH domain